MQRSNGQRRRGGADGEHGRTDSGEAGQGEYGEHRYGDSKRERPWGEHDPDYQNWREQQLKDYDRRYALWRDEQAKRFDEDYRNWLNARARGSVPSTGSRPSRVGSSGSSDFDSGESSGAAPPRPARR